MGNQIQNKKQNAMSEERKSIQIYSPIRRKKDGQKENTKCLNKNFLKKFNQISKKFMNFQRSQNPFCPFQMHQSQNWMTCCFISPIMAVANPTYLFDNQGNFSSGCQIIAVSNGKINRLQVKTALLIEKRRICLLVLEQPYQKVGWMSITYINQPNDIKSYKLRSVNHPEKVYEQKQNTLVHKQQIKQIPNVQVQTYQQNFYSKCHNFTGSGICSVKKQQEDQNLSLIGMQINQQQFIIFNKKIYNKIYSVSKKYIEKNYKQFVKYVNKTFEFLENDQNEFTKVNSIRND